MNQIGNVYANALYSLAADENLSKTVLDELMTLDGIISREEDFLHLLSAAPLSKDERCGIVDEIFKDKVHPYILNFMKILTEKGYKIPDARKRIAVIYDCGKALDAIKVAEEFREGCDVSLFEKPKKLGKLLSKLENAGFDGFHVLGETADGEIRPLG